MKVSALDETLGRHPIGPAHRTEAGFRSPPCVRSAIRLRAGSLVLAIGFLALARGCSPFTGVDPDVVAEGGSDAASDPDVVTEGGGPADAAPKQDGERDDGSSPVVDLNCSDVKARLATTADGAYWISPLRVGDAEKPFQVFCAGMETLAPKEYLELKRVSTPALLTANYSTFATGTPHLSWTCDCGNVTLVYSKVRIDPVSLVVDGSDTTYAVYSANTDTACLTTKAGCDIAYSWFGHANACVDNSLAAGSAQVDLTGTQFHIAGTGTAMFKPVGFNGAGTAEIDPTRKVLVLTGGGNCGGFGVGQYDKAVLPLAQD